MKKFAFIAAVLALSFTSVSQSFAGLRPAPPRAPGPIQPIGPAPVIGGGHGFPVLRGGPIKTLGAIN